MPWEPPQLPPPPPPPPPPPSSFPIPFARQRSTGHTQNAASNSAYLQPGPPPGNNHHPPNLVPSPNAHTSQLYASPQPPPLRNSTRPHHNVTAPAPAPTLGFTTQPAPPYEYAPRPPAPQMSGSFSRHSSVSDPGPGPSIPGRPPFTAAGTGTDASGPRPPQRLTTMPVPVIPNTAAPVPYHSGSSPPNIVYPPPQRVMSGGPPPSTQGWSYLDWQERDDVSSDSGDEDSIQSPDGMSNSRGYTGQKSPTNPPYAGRRRRPKRRETAPASSSSLQAPVELEKCKLCPSVGPRHEWARLGHGGFCTERHKWQWEDTYIRK